MGNGAAGVLRGKRAWIISDGKAGHEIQMLGIAEALGVDAQIKPIAAPGNLYKLTAPYGPPPVAARFGAPGGPFAPPWPAIAFATGRLTTPYIRALKRKAGMQTFTVILLDPKTGPRSADLFWVPEHDTRRGANVVTTLTSAHRYAPERIAQLRSKMPASIAALPTPRVAVLIGGPNGDYWYGPDETARLARALAALAQSGAGLMITASRRTPPDLLDAVGKATETGQRFFWRGEGPNPYPDFLASADAFVVTADSVNMVGEAAATGRPIHVFHPAGGSSKFDRFHAVLSEKGITRPFNDGRGLESWNYEPLDSARNIACEIERRYAARLKMIPGLCQGGGCE